MFNPRAKANRWLLPLTLLTATAVAGDRCVDCHRSEDHFAQNPKIHRYFQDWAGSPHALADVSCADCHGGDARGEGEDPHAGVLPMSNPESTLHATNQPDTCGDCHRPKRNQFVRSKHFRALVEARAAPTCTTCHPAMNKRPDYRSIVLNACRSCHGEDNEQGLPLVGRQAEHAFQQLDIAGGFLGWARLHFEKLEWPGDSDARVGDLEARHQRAIDRVHRFDMDDTEREAVELLADLRALFDDERARSEKR